MTRFLCLLFLIIMAYAWNACSCKTEASGIVLDAETLQPLEGVYLQLELAVVHGDTLHPAVRTNTAGEYELVHFYCKNYALTFSKDNYIGYTTKARLQDTIFLTPSEEEGTRVRRLHY